jgi:hypothetical protein
MKLDVNGPMPNVTPAQLVSVIGAIIAMIVAFGIPISQSERDAVINLATVFFPVLLGADALIRHGRSRVLMAEPSPIRDDTPPTSVSILDGSDSVVGAHGNGGGEYDATTFVLAGQG